MLVYEQAILVYNLPFTLFLGFTLLYWVLSIVGFVAEDSLDFDMDMEADGALAKVLEGFNFGILPFPTWFSIFSITAWILSVNLQYFVSSLVGQDSLQLVRLLAGLVGFSFIGGFCAGLVARVVVKFGPSQGQLPASAGDSFVGKTVRVTTSKVDRKFGQAELQTEGAPMLLDIRAAEYDGLTSNDTAEIYEYDKEQDIYWVSKKYE